MQARWLTGFRLLPAVAALALVATAVPAAAMPGMVTGEAMGQLGISVGENDALDLAFAYPAFTLTYDSYGNVHEDGFDTGFLDDRDIVMGMDVYAYAFSAPMVTELASGTRGIGRFADGVFATITNISTTSQIVDLSFSSSLQLLFGAAQPFDRIGGQIGFAMRGFGDAAPIAFGAFGRVAPVAGTGGSWSDNRAGSASFSLAPGGVYRLSISDYVGRIDIQAAAVPEPAVWLQLIIGFAGVGAVLRSRGLRRLA